jgi:hypothetical protein
VDLTAHVPRDIIDLLSTFIPNRRADIGQLRAALAERDWPRLQHIAERMYALGNPYGFRQITTFGRFMREACTEQNYAAFKRLIDEYASYLSKVTIVEVEAPLIRHVIPVGEKHTLASDAESAGKADKRAKGKPQVPPSEDPRRSLRK